MESVKYNFLERMNTPGQILKDHYISVSCSLWGRMVSHLIDNLEAE